ncbi:PAS domain-containing protein [Gemmatimonas sp.]|uniref:PAS domain-containing protein n=1 Tax=Gemmatimonas sp. TaxID=1962908 RepID=UPI0035638A35
MPREVVGIIEGVGDTITRADDAFLAMVDRDRADLIAGRLNWREMTPPEFLRREDAGLKEALTAGGDGYAAPFRKEFVRPDGTRVPVLVCCALHRDMLGQWTRYVVDLGAREAPLAAIAPMRPSSVEPNPAGFLQRLIGELTEERRRLFTMLDGTTSLIWAVDRDLHLVSSNAAFQAALRPLLSRNLEVGDLAILPMLPDAMQAQWRGLYLRALAGERFIERTDVAVNSTEIVNEHTFSPIYDASGVITGVAVVSTDVTSRVAAERAEAARKYELEAAQRLAGIGSWEWDPRTNVTQWSEEMFRIYDRDPASGAPLYDELERYHGADDLQKLQAFVERALVSGEPYAMDTTFKRRDGADTWVFESAEVVRDANGVIVKLRGATLDITDRKNAVLGLSQSEAKLLEVQRIARMGSWDWKIASDAVTWSSSLLEIFGLDADTTVPPYAQHAQYYTPESWELLGAAVTHAVAAHQPFQLDLEMMPERSRVRWIVSRGEPVIDQAGAVVGLQGIVIDVSERKVAEEENRRLELALVRAQKTEAVGQLAGGIAHDFNNILTAMLIEIQELLSEPPRPEQLRDGLRDLQLAADRAASLTRQLLLFSRRQVLQVRPLELNGLMADLARMLRRLIGEDVTLEVRASAQELWFDGDVGMIEQVITNLIVNARDAMPRGGRILVRTAALTVEEGAEPRDSNARAGRFVAFEVVDEGHGVRPDLAAHVFEPFFTTKEAGKGTGLGLATAFGIAQQHRGWIELASPSGGGATFTVVLPMASARPIVSAIESPVSTRAATPARVLLVEDDAAVRRTLSRSLAGIGYEIILAVDGPEALRQWSDYDGQIDLVVSDMVMPGGISGLELLERLSQLKPDLRTILMSGYISSAEDRSRVEQTGGRLLAKPFNAEGLRRAVAEALAVR